MDLKYLKHLAKRGASYIHPKGYEATRLLIENLRIQPGEKILELGCGTGATLCEIAGEYYIKIEGIDVLEEMIKMAKERIEYLNLMGKAKVRLYNPGQKFPFEENIFDKVYAESVLGFQEKNEMKFLITETSRVIKPQGLLILNDAFWKENTGHEIVSEFSAAAYKSFGIAHASPSGITKNIFITLALSRGFNIIKTIDLSSPDVKNSGENNKTSEMNRKKKLRKTISPGYLFNEVRFKRKMALLSRFSEYIEAFILVFQRN